MDVGDAVEYYCDIDLQWFPGTVVTRRYEGHTSLLRSFQIYALGSFAGDFTRIGVEEGHRLASPGSNLNPTVFRFYGIDVNAVKDKQSVMRSSALASSAPVSSSTSSSAAAPISSSSSSSSSSPPVLSLIQPQQPCSTVNQDPFITQSRPQQPHLQQSQQKHPQVQQKSQQQSQLPQPQQQLQPSQEQQQPNFHSSTKGPILSIEKEKQSNPAGAEVRTDSALNASSYFQASHVSVVQDAKEFEGVAAGDEAVVAITTTTAATTTFSLASSDSGMSGRSNSSDGSSSSYDDRSLSPATLTDSPLALIDETSTIPVQPSKQQHLQHQATHAQAHGAVLNVKQTPTNPINGCGIGINGVDGAMDVEENNADMGLDKDKGYQDKDKGYLYQDKGSLDKGNVSDSDGTKTTREDRRNHTSNGCYGNGNGNSSNGVGGSGTPMEGTHIDDNQ